MPNDDHRKQYKPKKLTNAWSVCGIRHFAINAYATHEVPNLMISDSC